MKEPTLATSLTKLALGLARDVRGAIPSGGGEARAPLGRLVARFGEDQRGVSAVEFAMLLPLMLTLYLGTAEISLAVGTDRKVTLTTRTVADLASQVKNITNADMTN